MTNITVAICTWNRAQLLDRTLNQMRNLQVPPDVDWELLVVNNNCTDDTDAVIARHRGALPIQRLFEPRQGQSNARNCAVSTARGELLIWTDDDVIVDPEWLIAYKEAADRWPEAGYFGGLIEPWFECTPPAWLLKNSKCLESMLVIRDLGPHEHYFCGDEEPYGANMAFRTRLLKEHRFDPNLGLTGDNAIRGDELTLIADLRSKGIAGVWVPQARVKHFVVRERLTRSYLWKYCQGAGRTHVRQNPLEHLPQTEAALGGVPRWLFRRMAESWVRAQWKRLWSNREWVSAYRRAAIDSGIILEARQLARKRPPVTATATGAMESHEAERPTIGSHLLGIEKANP